MQQGNFKKITHSHVGNLQPRSPSLISNIKKPNMQANTRCTWKQQLAAIIFNNNQAKVELKGAACDQCSSLYRSHRMALTQNQICAGGEQDKDSCQGRLMEKINFQIVLKCNNLVFRWFWWSIDGRWGFRSSNAISLLLRCWHCIVWFGLWNTRTARCLHKSRSVHRLDIISYETLK